MPANMYTQNEKVHDGMVQEVRTPIGEVLVMYGRGGVEVSFHPRGGAARADFDIEDGEPTMRIKVGRRPPAIGDEVTQNGGTFEVIDVKHENGKHWLKRDSGVREEWVER